MPITEFVQARLDEDEGVARAFRDGSSWGNPYAGDGDGSDVAYSNRFDEARVLAQCAAMRKIVDEYEALRGVAKSLAEQGADGEAATGRAMYAGILRAVQALACIWSDHADFREEWR